MKFLRLEMKAKGYTDYDLNLIEIETGEIIAIFQTNTLELGKLYNMVAHFMRYEYNENFSLSFKLNEQGENKNG